MRESGIKDEFRPAVVAAIMLALWFSKGDVRRDPRYILRDIDELCRDAFIKAGKADLARVFVLTKRTTNWRDTRGESP